MALDGACEVAGLLVASDEHRAEANGDNQQQQRLHAVLLRLRRKSVRRLSLETFSISRTSCTRRRSPGCRSSEQSACRSQHAAGFGRRRTPSPRTRGSGQRHGVPSARKRVELTAQRKLSRRSRLTALLELILCPARVGPARLGVDRSDIGGERLTFGGCGRCRRAHVFHRLSGRSLIASDTRVSTSQHLALVVGAARRLCWRPRRNR